MEHFRRYMSKITVIESDLENFIAVTNKNHMEVTIQIGEEVKKLEGNCKFKKDSIWDE